MPGRLAFAAFPALGFHPPQICINVISTPELTRTWLSFVAQIAGARFSMPVYAPSLKVGEFPSERLNDGSGPLRLTGRCRSFDDCAKTLKRFPSEVAS